MKRLLILSSILLMFSSFSFGQTLFINEFLASNDFGMTDPAGDNDDWIEIYNAGTEAVDIGGLYITDDLSDPTCWQIPTTQPDSTTIPAGGFLILWADKEAEQGVLHLGEVKLSGSGEQIGLVQVVGTDTSFIDSLTYFEQATDTSYGRSADGADTWGPYYIPTPGSSNSDGFMVSIDTRSNFSISDFRLNQNYPNPFNPTTTISYTMPVAERVTISVYNAIGQKVVTLLDENGVVGAGSVEWNAKGMSSGIYFYSIKSLSFKQTKSLK